MGYFNVNEGSQKGFNHYYLTPQKYRHSERTVSSKYLYELNLVYQIRMHIGNEPISMNLNY